SLHTTASTSWCPIVLRVELAQARGAPSGHPSFLVADEFLVESGLPGSRTRSILHTSSRPARIEPRRRRVQHSLRQSYLIRGRLRNLWPSVLPDPRSDFQSRPV